MSYLESALEPQVLARLQVTGSVDIVIGLPTYKNTRTIGGVITAIGDGLALHYPGSRALVLVSDGGSTDDTLTVARRTPLPPQASLVATPYRGITGKGSAMRAVLEVADALKARACAIFDADVRSITPDWIERLVGPVLADQADFVSPYYTRDRHEVTINDMIAYPLTRALYGFDIRQPLGGEIALSPRAWQTYVARDVWETDVARFGVHIWMMTLAINSGWRLYQAPLGTKTHDYKDPTVGFEPKFMQIVGTLFRLMSIYRRVWPEVPGTRPVPMWGEVHHLDPDPVPTTRQTLWDGFLRGMKRYRRNLRTILTDDQRTLLKQLANGERPPFPDDVWAQIVMDFAVVYNRGEGDPDKVALALLPVYYARKASLLREVEGKPWTAVEDAIHRQADVFVRQKEYLVDRWITYVPWQAPRESPGTG
jgi:glucosylglycerate synthase